MRSSGPVMSWALLEHAIWVLWLGLGPDVA